MELDVYERLLNHFDTVLWDRKTDPDSNWNYNGLILNYYFDNSVLSYDYLNIEEFFKFKNDFAYSETTFLAVQYKNVNEEKRVKLIENILNVLKYSTYDKDNTEAHLNKAISYLVRHGIKVTNPENGPLHLSDDNRIGVGSYCVVKLQSKGIVRKELLSEHRNNTDLQKRMKYEYENMLKLINCPQVLNVYSFDTNDFSYLMEQADMDLYEYLKKEVDTSFEQKTKIVHDVLNGMKFAHEQSIIHRDLHLGNVLKVGNDFVLSDFGLSKDESIERSLKSSQSEKNNHSFVDPTVHGDFTKLDKKSDIYSIGKIIDYVFTLGATDSNHFLSFVVDKCTIRDKQRRYDSVEEILNDIEFKLKERNSDFDKQRVLEKIQNDVFDIQVMEYIKDLVKANRICDYLVKNKLNSFGEIILQMGQIEQIATLQAIDKHYANSTGYRQFHNYDIFTDISFFVCNNTSESKVFSIAHTILEGCAKHRFKANDYLIEIDKVRL